MVLVQELRLRRISINGLGSLLTRNWSTTLILIVYNAGGSASHIGCVSRSNWLGLGGAKHAEWGGLVQLVPMIDTRVVPDSSTGSSGCSTAARKYFLASTNLTSQVKSGNLF